MTSAGSEVTCEFVILNYQLSLYCVSLDRSYAMFFCIFFFHFGLQDKILILGWRKKKFVTLEQVGV